MKKRTIFGTAILLAVTFGASVEAGPLLIPSAAAEDVVVMWLSLVALIAAFGAGCFWLGMICRDVVVLREQTRRVRRVFRNRPARAETDQSAALAAFPLDLDRDAEKYSRNYYGHAE